MRGYPDLTIAKFKRAMVFSPAALDRMAENLRKLGLPD
jgi:adenylate cyclase